MNLRYSNMFRFSFALLDLVILNLIHFILILVLQRLANRPIYTYYFIFTNLSWLICAYITAVYVGKHQGYESFYKRTVHAFAFYFALTISFVFLSNFYYSRLFVFLSFFGFGLSLLISRIFILGANYFIERKKQVRKVLIIGYNELSRKLVRNLTGFNKSIEVVGYCDEEQLRNDNGLPYMGSLITCIEHSMLNGINEIYCTISPEQNNIIYEIAEEAERNFIRFKFVPDFRMFIDRSVHVDFSHDIPVLSYRPDPLEDFAGRIKKRSFDIVFSTLIIFFVLSWLVPIIAILIKLNSRGPVFFKQLRSGKSNRPFLCYKFRSLRMNKEADSKQVTKDDDRFTRVGKFLRKTSLDELPQFFNVFWGEMSVVGPRPHMLKHTEEYSNIVTPYMLRHFVKPGVTGWAQIHGYRGEIKEHEQLRKRIEYDIYYMENWSMWLDLRIIILTVYHVFHNEDVY